MSADSYIASHRYESFICLARLCGSEDYGADYSYMKNVIEMERGSSSVNHLKYEKELAFVKKSILEALQFVKSRTDINAEDKTLISEIIEQAEKAESSHLLLIVCVDGAEILYKYK